MPPAAQPTLLLVDGLNIVRRVHKAVPGDDEEERAEGAIKSSWGSVMRALREHGPTHFLAAFDFGGHTWRHDIYSTYKASREPMPEPLRARLPWFIERMNNAGLRAIQVPGVEADDVIATLAVRARQRGFRVIVASSDKDLCRLVEFGVELRDHFENVWRDEAWVQSRFGVSPRQIPDYLALMGDDTDDIPGVPGVGEKTAPKLLAEHGDLSGVLAAALEMKGKIGAQLRENAPLASLSLRLATLKTDVDLGRLTPRDIQLPQDMRFFPVPATIHAGAASSAIPVQQPSPRPERRYGARP